jgi:hypothetical protein
VYRFFARGVWSTVFADNGTPLRALTADDAVREAHRFAPEHAATLRYGGRLTEPDQWTLERPALLPVHRVALGDAGDSHIYISERTGEVVMKTTSRERRWAYAGAVVHWLYFTPLRRNSALWTRTIIWASIAGSVLCLLGLTWGVYTARQSPYAGWMRWHHYAGLVFGLTSFTWVFSGLLSMDPWNWHPGTEPTTAQRDRMSGGPLRLGAVSLDSLRARHAKQIEVVQFLGEPRLIVDEHTAGELDRDRLISAVQASLPGVAVEDAKWLDRYDAYYYDRRGELPLPVVRVRFLDDSRTWLYADPRRGALVRREVRLSRVNRWLYHGLHSLDLPGFYTARPLWDAVVIVLSLGGLLSSVTILVPVWKRLRRHAQRLYSLIHTLEVSADATWRS